MFPVSVLGRKARFATFLFCKAGCCVPVRIGTATCRAENMKCKGREIHLHPHLVCLPMPVRVSSIIFSICHCFPEAVKPCPKSPCVFTALNEMVSKFRDYNNEHLSGGKGEKGKEMQPELDNLCSL